MSDTILIVDDDPEITSALARGLARHGYDVLAEHRIAPALDVLKAQPPKAAIFDVMLGSESGLDLTRRARAAGFAGPILMLSALAEVEDRAEGLEAGADDYIVKPFSFDELVARLKVQERRVSRPALVLDRAGRTVRHGPREAVLTEREFALFEALHGRAGQVLSRWELFEMVWAGEGTSSENVVDVYVGYLRRKLAPMTDFGFEIQTVRNRGFVLQLLDGGKS
ncbi:response regulator transcription factor [Algicella marina]|uniref:Response regulator n=1 Tax=Algicella marina TaxID=2683284 RepID=A0A6P1SUH0_9RHOB|nr:response regulator transcription factor [Algicella marina]QHQ34324.1 response regulator [Algicella marina]